MVNYGQRPLNPNPVYNADYKKYLEKHHLRKKSSGLGFFVMVYFLCMLVSTVALEVFLMILTADSEKVINDLTGASPLTHYYTIFLSVFSAVIPSVFYLIISKNKLNDCVKVKPVKANILVPVIFIGLAVAMIANVASDTVSTGFSYFGLENSIDFSESSSSLYMNILYVISTAIVPALAEEFAFRGVLMGVLRKYGDSFAIITSAVMFGAMHGNIVQIPFAFILGLVFGYVDCKTDSIIPSVIIHFLNNLYAVILDILSTEGIISDSAYYLTYIIIVAAICILGMLSFIRINKTDGNFFRISDSSPLSLSLREKNICFFTNPGVVLSLSFFLIEAVTYLVVI